MSSSDKDERFRRLVDWSQSHGGHLHEAVEIYKDDVTKVSLRVRPQQPDNAGATRLLQAEDTVVSCPLSSSLSYLNALARGRPLGRAGPSPNEDDRFAFPDAVIHSAPPHVLGRYFLVQQYLLGPQSYWYPYIATLPQPGQTHDWALPASWPPDSDALALLAGTNAGTAAAEMRGHLDAELQQMQSLLETHGYNERHRYTRQLYDWAFCVFTSRSFRPSLVLPAELQAALRGETGATGSDNDTEGQLPQLPLTCQIDDFSVLLPVLDLANHDPRARVTWRTSAEPSPRVDFQTEQAYTPGQQVFNNYGPKTNSELLLGYGFLLPPTDNLHNDYVHLRKRGETATTPNTAATAGAGAGSADPPRDFLLSLRSMDDPSSLVGGARRWRKGPANILPGLALFEDALLWDLVTLLWTEADQQRLRAATEGAVDAAADAAAAPTIEAQRAVVLEELFREPDANQPEAEDQPYAALVERVRETLLAKAGMDYERLVEADPDEYEDNEDDGSEDDHRRQASAYREQYRSVLIHALTTLDPELEIVEAA